MRCSRQLDLREADLGESAQACAAEEQCVCLGGGVVVEGFFGDEREGAQRVRVALARDARVFGCAGGGFADLGEGGG